MMEIFYRLRVEGMRTDPSSTSRIRERAGHYYTNNLPVDKVKLYDGMIGWGVSPNKETMKGLNQAIKWYIKPDPNDTRILDYRITAIEYLDDRGRLLAESKVSIAVPSMLHHMTIVNMDITKLMEEQAV